MSPYLMTSAYGSNFLTVQCSASELRSFESSSCKPGTFSRRVSISPKFSLDVRTVRKVDLLRCFRTPKLPAELGELGDNPLEKPAAIWPSSSQSASEVIATGVVSCAIGSVRVIVGMTSAAVGETSFVCTSSHIDKVDKMLFFPLCLLPAPNVPPAFLRMDGRRFSSDLPLTLLPNSGMSPTGNSALESTEEQFDPALHMSDAEVGVGLQGSSTEAMESWTDESDVRLDMIGSSSPSGELHVELLASSPLLAGLSTPFLRLFG
mmetsp:Transcript_55287/g.101373  ORF Transcript_55287/g.101373 Transcript_55287/m.101373 type:complete len:263 (+) Transcript_55287:2309-3097(+)